MAASWFSCIACSESDPNQDTVKVNPTLLDKENVQPLQLQKQTANKESPNAAEEEEARRQKEEAAVAAIAEAARLHDEVEKTAAEAARLEEAARWHAEGAVRHEALQRAASEKARGEEAARGAAASAAREERQRVEVARAAQEQARLARKEAEEKINVWCKSNGFQDMDVQKKTLRGATKFPLHTAVKHNNQEIIGMMLLTGVHKDVRDSNKQTPSQLAEKLNKDGSHSQILTMLL